MKDNTLNEGDFDEIETDHDKEQRQIYAHLRALFDLSGIGENGRQALRCATLLPQNGMQDALFVSALPKAAATEIKLLEKKGWVDLKEGLVTIHPVVRLVCRTELDPTEENCEDFLKFFEESHNKNDYDRVKFKQLAELYSCAANTMKDRNGDYSRAAAFFWHKIGELKNELGYAQKVVRKREENCKDSLKLAYAYESLGGAYGGLGDYWKELDYQLKVLEVYKKEQTVSFIDLARCYCNIGITYGNLGNKKESLRYLWEALAIREQGLPPDHVDIAFSHNCIGYILNSMGCHMEALEHHRKAQGIYENARCADHMDIALNYNNMGLVYGDLGKHNLELECQMKALAIYEEILPELHPELALSYNNVGCAYYAMGNQRMALEYLLRSLDIRERILPKEHPDLVQAYNNIACIYYAMTRLPEAVIYMRRAANSLPQTLPKCHPDRVQINYWLSQFEEEARRSREGA